MEDLKQRSVRGGLAKLCGQAVNFVLHMTFLVIMARLLNPKDFGLVAMVTAVTGLYGLFTTGGLSAATVQKTTITDEQISTLFWINMLIGTVLAVLCLLTAPALVKFYDEPRLFWVTAITAAGFVLNAAGVQHFALLHRHLRFVTLTGIDTLSQLASVAIGIGMAVAGLGYWALVASTIVVPAVGTICVWTVTRWIPGLPRPTVGISSMLRFGGIVTLNSLIVYIAYNLEKVLLGRFWGADVLGLYGRAYQLINVPTGNLHAAIGGLVFSALSRLQSDPVRFRSYFLKAYSLVNSLTVPTTMFCGLFADDIILVVLGPKWTDAASIFRLLTPTVLIFGIINPLGWLLLPIGLQGRSLLIALVIAPIVITAYVIGLPFGPNGVALAYSVAMMLWLVPHILWCLHRTPISLWDLFQALGRPFLACIVALVFAFSVQYHFGESQSPFFRLALASSITAIVYFGLLLFMGQKAFYLDLFKGLNNPSSLDVR